MSETADKRRRSDLDLFVLALIESGVSTPYEFQKSAGISQGASIPVLRRLIEGGLVRPKKAGLRGRTAHQITLPGRKTLREGWRTLVDDEPSGDLEADLRVALLALAVGRDRRAAAEYLRRSADKKTAVVGQERKQAEVGPVLARWYSSLRADAVKSLHRAESEVIRALADDLPKNLTRLSGQDRPAPQKRKTS
jgi:DNA-binding PadR family transcriptional regulator